MVDDENFVGQVEHHVALVGRPLQLQVDRVELEGEIVAEGAVEADAGIRLRMEEIGDGAQHGERPSGIFERSSSVKTRSGILTVEVEPARGRCAELKFGDRLQPLGDEAEDAPRRGSL